MRDETKREGEGSLSSLLVDPGVELLLLTEAESKLPRSPSVSFMFPEGTPFLPFVYEAKSRAADHAFMGDQLDVILTYST